jgi:hypothetical protein
MPNGIRYSASIVSGALNKNQIALAISGNYGPTATTGFFNGIDPTGSNGLGYVIYKTTTNNSSSIFVPQTNNELLSLARQEGATGANTGSNAAILSYFAATNLYLPINFTYPTIYATGLSRNFDAGFVGSYPTTGSIWYGIGQGGSVSLVNGPTFIAGVGNSTYGSGSLSFDGTNDTTSNIGLSSGGVFTVSVWIYTNLSTNATYSIIGGTVNNTIGLIYSNGTQSIQIGTANGLTTSYDAGTDGNNGWVNYTITRDGGSNIVVYKNNVSLGTSNRSGAVTFVAIAKSSTSAYLSGLIGNILVYPSTLLTTDQLTANYNALKGIYGL